MTTTTITFTFPPPGYGDGKTFFDAMTQFQHNYTNPFQDTFQEYWTSSVRIVQEQTVKAMAQAAQQSFFALSQNAADLNQRAFLRLFTANQEAFTWMTGAWTKAVLPGFRPAA